MYQIFGIEQTARFQAFLDTEQQPIDPGQQRALAYFADYFVFAGGQPVHVQLPLAMVSGQIQKIRGVHPDQKHRNLELLVRDKADADGDVSLVRDGLGWLPGAVQQCHVQQMQIVGDEGIRPLGRFFLLACQLDFLVAALIEKVAYFPGVIVGKDVSVIEENHPAAKPLDVARVVADEQHGLTLPLDHVFHAIEALALECQIADRKHFVNNENIRIHARCDAETQPHRHSGAIPLDWSVDKLLELGKSDDLVELLLDLGVRHSQNYSIEIDILAAGQIGNQSRTDLDQGRDFAANAHGSRRRRADPCQQLEHRAFAGAIAADDPQHVSLVDAESDVVQGLERRFGHPVSALDPCEGAPQRLTQTVALPQVELLGYMLYGDGRHSVSNSSSSRSDDIREIAFGAFERGVA